MLSLYFSGPMPSCKNDLAGISAINITKEYAPSFTMTVQCVELLKSNLQSNIFEHCNLYYGEAEKAANIVQSVESIIFCCLYIGFAFCENGIKMSIYPENFRENNSKLNKNSKFL
jgi:hypothetical protein